MENTAFWCGIGAGMVLGAAVGMAVFTDRRQRETLERERAFTRAAAHELKAEVFSALGAEHPDLYRQLVQILDRRTKEARR